MYAWVLVCVCVCVTYDCVTVLCTVCMCLTECIPNEWQTAEVKIHIRCDLVCVRSACLCAHVYFPFDKCLFLF